MFDGGFCFATNATHGNAIYEVVDGRCHGEMGGLDAVDMYVVCADGQAAATLEDTAANPAPTAGCLCSTPRLCTNNGCGCATGCVDLTHVVLVDIALHAPQSGDIGERTHGRS